MIKLRFSRQRPWAPARLLSGVRRPWCGCILYGCSARTASEADQPGESLYRVSLCTSRPLLCLSGLVCKVGAGGICGSGFL